MSASRPTRRRAIGLLVVGAALGPTGPLLGACTADETTRRPVDRAGLDADRRIALALLVQLGGLQVLVHRTRAGSAADRRRFAALAGLHRAQEDALGGTGRQLDAADTIPPARDAAAVRSAESRWIRQLTDAAVRAAEPRFALLLGAMAAGTAQELTRLEGRVETDPVPGTALTAGEASDALQDALAAEHAALYVIEALGARTAFDSGLRDRLGHLADRHRARREALIALLLDADSAPVGPASSYEVPTDLVSAAAITARIGEVEEDLLPRYAALVAAAEGRLRGWALGLWRTSAQQAVRYGRDPTALPGLAAS